MSPQRIRCTKFGEKLVGLHSDIGVEVEHVFLMDADVYEIPFAMRNMNLHPNMVHIGYGIGKFLVPVHFATHIDNKVVIVHKEDECMIDGEPDQ